LQEMIVARYSSLPYKTHYMALKIKVMEQGMVEEADTVHQDIVRIDTGTETIDVIIVLIETAEIDTEKGTGVQGREIIIENEVAAEKGIVKLSIENIMKTEIVTETGRGKGTGKEEMIVTGIQDLRRPESRKSLEERKQGRRRGDKK